VVQVKGTVEKVVYNKGSYYILDFLETSKNRVTVKGSIFGVDRISSGTPFVFDGRWIRSQKYGRQIQIQSWDFPQRASNPELVTFLRDVAGFDLDVAGEVVKEFGADTIEVLTQNQDAVHKACTRDPDALVWSLSRWDRLLAVRALSGVLKDGGLTSGDIEAAVTKFGMDAPALIQENPFRLMEIPGFNFERVDSLALRLGHDLDNPQRLEGASLWALNEAGRDGHLFLKRGDIPTRALDLRDSLGPLPLSDTADRGFRAAIRALTDRGALVVEEVTGAYLPEAYEYERGSARMLARLMTPSPLQIELAPFLEEFERSSQLELSDAQQEAVGKLIDNKVLVLTGLPGTGKTTAVKALVRLFEVSRTSFSLMAPTGIASKRLSHVTGHPASTIHRALGYDGMSWQYGPDSKYVIDAVIVDEVSMVDQELLYRLLSALRHDTMLVLVGDDAQLPSVGPGNVLRELVACDLVPNVKLTEIFRQSTKGAIVSNSHLINRGEFPVLGDPKGNSEFRFIPMANEEKACQAIVKMAAKLKERDANFQVLSPKYDGPVGVNALNDSLRDVLNPPGPPEWSGKYRHFRLGDRIMVVKNNYKKGVYNGDVGKLLYLGSDQIVLRIYGVGAETDQEVSFTEKEADEYLRLAYAITVHKSQGSEFDTIILPVMNSQGRMLQRNLLYTAVTRAKKRVWLIGEESAIRRAIENNKVLRRNTALGMAVAGVWEGADGD
jgi:exodeoxyribonuclease V alpha subunit